VYGAELNVLSALAERARTALPDLGLREEAGELAIELSVDEHADWETAWTRYLQQQPLTDRWVIQPVWDQTPAPSGLGRILIQPTLAFGDGAHVTTRLAAQAVERFCLALPGARVLDIGTGTGVLALVAALSGARVAVGVDIDRVALDAARENAKLNGLEGKVVFEDALAAIDGVFDLVVANLEPRVLSGEAARIAERAAGARELALTGFLVEQTQEILSRFEAFGFAELGRVQEGEWCLAVLGPARG
jgi:ribosomal protein L11 methyltransferase